MRAVAVVRALAALSLFAATLNVFTAVRAEAQSPTQQAEVLTGTVKSDSGVAIPNAQITVTPAGGGFSVAVTVRSNEQGRWTASIPNRAAEYFVTVSAIGWVQQRTTVKTSGNGNPVVVDVALKKAAVQLGPVRITETRRQPPQREVIGPDVAATEKGIIASSEVFAVADQGDLMGMIAQVPGIQLTNDPSSGLPGFSVLGLSGAQNNVTLNGLNFGGSDVPRDIIGAVRVSASTYDVSRGGFSGAQLSVTQAAGNNFMNQIVHATLDAPGFQAT
ncbi:MAG TPA: carboxypeptidase-like regulatory domain-containing protein, partial [Gemmatimonadaceae bacterium]